MSEPKKLRGEADHCKDRMAKYCKGQGLDLGCGAAKIKPSAIGVDIYSPHADSNHDARILKGYPKDHYDYVFSSHLLEEIQDTEHALRRWLEVLKPGGNIVLYQADKYLYYPLGHPDCNPNHKHHFGWEDLWEIFQKIGGVTLIHHNVCGIKGEEGQEWSFELVVQKEGPKVETFNPSEAISILTPSYKRPSSIERFCKSIHDTAVHKEKIEIVFGVHEDDPDSIKKIKELDSKLKMSVRYALVKRHRNGEFNFSFMWNQLYGHAKYDIIGFFGDDVVFKTPGWDEEVFKEFDKDKQVMVSCNDVHVQRGHNAILFFTHREVHDKIGHYMNEKYRRWYMDTFLDRIYRGMGKLHYREDLITEHHNPLISKHHDQTSKPLIDADEKEWGQSASREIKECINRVKAGNVPEVKQIKIIQPGRIGDIIICLPIAKHYHDQGYEVYWPVCSEFFTMFDYVDYVRPHDLGPFNGNSRTLCDLAAKAKTILPKAQTLDLAVGFLNNALDKEWKESGMTFDEWKYKKSGVPFEKKYDLQINRNTGKEEKLLKQLTNGNPYIVTHSKGGQGYKHNFNKPGAIEVKHIEGYTLFDWLKILEEASEVYCIDSSVANLINQLGICKDRRFYKPVSGDKMHVSDKDCRSPQMDKNWKLI